MSFNFSPRIVTDGLVLHLDAANIKSYPGSGINWFDLSKSSNNGVLVNNPIFNNSNFGNIIFNGLDNYVDNIGNTTDYNFIFSEGTFSISFWVKRTNNNTRYVFAGNTLTNNEKGWFIVIEFGVSGFGDNCLRFHASGNALNTKLIAGSTDDNTINTSWTHCVFTCENPDKVGKWYINGVSVNTTTRLGSGNDIQGTYYNGPSTRVINIGRSNFNTTVTPLNGNIAQFSIYKKKLSPQEVLQNYNTTKTRFGL